MTPAEEPVRKRITFVISTPPYGSARALECIEAVLVAGVFDQSVSVIFRDDGVWGLLDHQDGALAGQRTFSKVLKSLPTYDVDRIFACEQACRDRGVKVEAMPVPVTLMSMVEQRQLLADSDAVIGDGS